MGVGSEWFQSSKHINFESIVKLLMSRCLQQCGGPLENTGLGSFKSVQKAFISENNYFLF